MFGAGKFRTAAWQTCGGGATASERQARNGPGFSGWESALTAVYGDVADLMAKPEFYGAMFQVASQANFLEFIDPTFSAANGIENYQDTRRPRSPSTPGTVQLPLGS